MFAGLSRLFRPKARESQWLDVATLRRQMGEGAAPLIVDVRGADEFDGPLGHIEGAMNIPLPELAARQDEIAAAGPVVCVCLTDKRSSAAAAQLAASGFDDVAVLRGGMKAWREAG